MLYLLAIIFPPLAVLLTGRIGAFLLNILLTLLFYVPGAIHAILVVNEHKADKRTDRLVQAMKESR